MGQGPEGERRKKSACVTPPFVKGVRGDSNKRATLVVIEHSIRLTRSMC